MILNSISKLNQTFIHEYWNLQVQNFKHQIPFILKVRLSKNEYMKSSIFQNTNWKIISNIHSDLIWPLKHINRILLYKFVPWHKLLSFPICCSNISGRHKIIIHNTLSGILCCYRHYCILLHACCLTSLNRPYTVS